MTKQQCAFAGVKEEKRHGDEPMYQCTHGKLLTWTTARRYLGLPAGPRNPEEAKKNAKSK